MSDSRQGKGKPHRGRKTGGGRTPRGGKKGQPARSSSRRSQSKSDRSRRGGIPHKAAHKTASSEQRTERTAKPTKLPAAAAGLPRNVVEALMRVTPASRQNAALAALGAAAEAFAEGQYHTAVRRAEHAKDLAPRDNTIREILGLSAYRVGDWQKSLRELRTYRRLSGETTHMPVEMDILRALERPEDVAATWEEFRKLGGGPAVKKEARVVYASHLIDRGELGEAARVAGSPRKTADPWPEDLRLWYVAARIAALDGDKVKARALADDIVLADPSFPGLDELDGLIEAG